MPITILLVDDHAIFREGVRVLLETSSDITVIGEAGDGLDALVLAERLRPDIVILDCMMPYMDGMEVTRWLRKQRPETQVVLLSMYDDESYVSTAMHNGASGYLLKDDIVAHLKEAILTVYEGGEYFSPGLKTRDMDLN